MYKDKCNIEYDLDNYVELQLRLQFDTEYDDSKVSITKDEMSDALNSCLSVIPEGYTSNVDVERRSIKLKVTPDTTIGQRLLDQLKASKTDKVVSNYDETEKMGLDVIKELEKVLSDKLKKEITIKYNLNIEKDKKNNNIFYKIKIDDSSKLDEYIDLLENLKFKKDKKEYILVIE